VGPAQQYGTHISNINQSNFTAIGIFQAHFGAAPGSQDARTECENWERLCDELLAERQRLCAELEKTRLDKICKNFKPDFTMDEVYSQLDRQSTVEQLIAELENAAEWH
jgi:hypothetical protein